MHTRYVTWIATLSTVMICTKCSFYLSYYTASMELSQHFVNATLKKRGHLSPTLSWKPHSRQINATLLLPAPTGTDRVDASNRPNTQPVTT